MHFTRKYSTINHAWYFRQGKSRISLSLTSSTRCARPPQFPQISTLLPRLRLTHNRNVRLPSSISCRYTLYPGHPKIRLNSRSVILQQFTALLHIPAQSRGIEVVPSGWKRSSIFFHIFLCLLTLVGTLAMISVPREEIPEQSEIRQDFLIVELQRATMGPAMSPRSSFITLIAGLR